MIVAPSGTCIAECGADEDTLLIETIDLDECVVPKQFHDLVGYYNRFDIFQLDVNRRPTQAITFDGQPTRSRNLSFDEIEAASGTGGDDQGKV